MSSRLAAVTLALVLFSPAASNAATMAFVAEADTTLSSIHPADNYGAAELLTVGSPGPRAAGFLLSLLRFDLSSVPDDALVTGATLEMEAIFLSRSAGSLGLVVREVSTSGWAEGDGDVVERADPPPLPSPVPAGYPTLESDSGLGAVFGSGWAGGAFDLSADTTAVTTLTSGPVPGAWAGSGAPLIAAAQGAVIASSPLELALADPSPTPRNWIVFASRDHPDAALRPTLTLTYVPAPSAGLQAGAALLALALLTQRRHAGAARSASMP